MDHEAELEVQNKDLCNRDQPILVYLCDFSNINTQDLRIDVKYLYNDLSRGKSIRSRIIASEELVKSGALNPGILFSTYKVKYVAWTRRYIYQLN